MHVVRGAERSRVWVDVASEVLGEATVESARVRLAEALLESTGLAGAARIRLEPDGSLSWFAYTGRDDAGAVAHLPASTVVREHPFHGYHVRHGAAGPARLADVIAAGWTMPLLVLESMERLGVPMHQLSVPVEQPGLTRGYDGWVLVAGTRVGERALHTSVRLQPLLTGLDRHLRLLGDLVPPCPEKVLTPREVLVLSMLAEGCTVTSIAHRMLISPRTVHKHQEHLYRKLGAADRLSAVMKAQQLGLLARVTAVPAASPG